MIFTLYSSLNNNLFAKHNYIATYCDCYIVMCNS